MRRCTTAICATGCGGVQCVNDMRGKQERKRVTVVMVEKSIIYEQCLSRTGCVRVCMSDQNRASQLLTSSKCPRIRLLSPTTPNTHTHTHTSRFVNCSTSTRFFSIEVGAGGLWITPFISLEEEEVFVVLCWWKKQREERTIPELCTYTRIHVVCEEGRRPLLRLNACEG